MARDVVEVLRESLSLSAKFGNRGRLTLTLDDARAILASMECAERMAKMLGRIDGLEMNRGRWCRNRDELLAEWEALRG